MVARRACDSNRPQRVAAAGGTADARWSQPGGRARETECGGVLDGGSLSLTTDRAPRFDADEAGDDRAEAFHGGEREIAWP